MRHLRFTVTMLLMLFFVAVTPQTLNSQATAPANNALTNRDILDMHHAEISTDIIVAKIKAGPSNFDTSPNALKDLKSAGIPDNVIVAMVEASSKTNPASTGDTGQKAATSETIAHLRVYRQRRFGGYALTPSIFVDDKQVVRVGNGRRCSIKLTPGSHTIRSDDKSSAITLDARAGQEFYIRVDEQEGFWKGHGKLTMMLPEQGSAEYKIEKPVEEDRKFAKEMIEDDTAGG